MLTEALEAEVADYIERHQVRDETEDRLCALVMIGVRPDGTKELIAIEDGYRESAES